MKYIFGPVPSRRLGSSLGIDIVPHKTCNLDCVYCEVGKTTKLTLKRDHYINVEEMLKEFKIAYGRFKDNIDVVTITGAGEPTLNLDLYDIIKEVKHQIEHPLAVLTNSTNLDKDDVQKALLNIDILVPSVDAISIDIFEKINRPHKKLNWDTVLDALKNFSRRFNGTLLIEVLFVKGLNDSQEELERLANYIKHLKYSKVQLNTVFRPPAYPNIFGLSHKELLEIAIFFSKCGLIVEPVGNFIKELQPHPSWPLMNTISSLLKLRPCTMKELQLLFSITEDELNDILKDIENIKKSHYNGQIYYNIERD